MGKSPRGKLVDISDKQGFQFSGHVLILGQLRHLTMYKRIERVFYGRAASVTQMLQCLEWDSLTTRRLLNQCSMFCKMHHGLVNIPFPETVIPAIRQGRCTNSMSYQTIQSRVNSYKYSFFVRIIPVWNRLPNSVIHATTASQFQSLALPIVRDMAATPTHQSL